MANDILADYREWRSQQEERIGTHSPDCHLWRGHERCMIHRLAEALEAVREAIRRLADQDAALSVRDGNVTVTMDATLTDAERGAVEWCLEMAVLHATDCDEEIATLRRLLERMK